MHYGPGRVSRTQYILGLLNDAIANVGHEIGGKNNVGKYSVSFDPSAMFERKYNHSSDCKETIKPDFEGNELQFLLDLLEKILTEKEFKITKTSTTNWILET